MTKIMVSCSPNDMILFSILRHMIRKWYIRISHHSKQLIWQHWAKKQQPAVKSMSSFAIITSLSVPCRWHNTWCFCWGLPVKLLSCWPFSDRQLLCQGSWFSLQSSTLIILTSPIHDLLRKSLSCPEEASLHNCKSVSWAEPCPQGHTSIRLLLHLPPTLLCVPF